VIPLLQGRLSVGALLIALAVCCARAPNHALEDRPISLACGSVNPHLIAVAISDQPVENLPPRTARDDTQKPVSVGPHPKASAVDENYRWNGGGAAAASLDTSCVLKPNQLQIVISSHLYGLSGHCCSGFGPGGQAMAKPDWNLSFTLPKPPLGRRWKLVNSYKIGTDIPQQRKCAFGIDGVFRYLPLNRPSASSPATLNPGPHTIELNCTSDELFEVRPGTWDTSAYRNEEASLLLTVSS